MRTAAWFAVGLVAAGCSQGEPGPAIGVGAPERPTPPRGGPGWLHEAAAESGLEFALEVGARGALHMPEIMAGGAAFLDCDGDGDLDVYLVNGGADAAAPAERGGIVNRLFENEGGRFVDATEGSGAEGASYGMGAAVGDVDGDGLDDLYLTSLGADQLLVSRGDMRFVDRTADAGVAVPRWSSSAAFVDYDRDGWLDVFVAQYVHFQPQKTCRDNADQPEYCGPKDYPPLPDVLLHADGRGGFTDASRAAGIAEVRAAGLGVVPFDADEDGWLDVYVANDGYENHLWTNRRDGTFVDDAVLLGAAFNMQGQAEAGMGVVLADLDGDALPDLFVTHLRLETNTFYKNLGPGAGFVDRTGPSGLGVGSQALTGFGTAALDLELDGDLDLVVVNGRVARGEASPACELSAPWCRYAEPALLYLNEGGHFEVRCDLATDFCGPLAVARGLAAGDYDDDGDLDLLVNGPGSAARLYRNDAPRSGRWLSVDAQLAAAGRRAVGTRVVLELPGGRRAVGAIGGAASYLSSGDPRAYFGVPVGVEPGDLRLVVTWPDGTHERFPVARLDARAVLVQGAGESVP